MSININKENSEIITERGKQIPLPGTLRVVDLMLGWEPIEVEPQHKVKDSSFGGLGKVINAVDNAVNTVTKSVDVDASALLVDAKGKVKNRVCFTNLHDNMNNIHHSGDNRTGKGEFPNETIHLKNLNDIDPRIQEIHFLVNIFSQTYDFGDIKECIAAVVDMEKREEICRYNLTGQYPGKSSILIGAISRAPQGGWIFTAFGEAYNERRIEEFIRNHY